MARPYLSPPRHRLTGRGKPRLGPPATGAPSDCSPVCLWGDVSLCYVSPLPPTPHTAPGEAGAVGTTCSTDGEFGAQGPVAVVLAGGTRGTHTGLRLRARPLTRAVRFTAGARSDGPGSASLFRSGQRTWPHPLPPSVTCPGLCPFEAEVTSISRSRQLSFPVGQPLDVRVCLGFSPLI